MVMEFTKDVTMNIEMELEMMEYDTWLAVEMSDIEDRQETVEMVMEVTKDDSWDKEMELDVMEYDVWLALELAEMGIRWGPNDSMMVEGSQMDDPHHHGGMLFPVHGPSTLPEKGWERKNELGIHTPGKRTPIDDCVVIDAQAKQSIGERTPINKRIQVANRDVTPLTPGLSNGIRMLEIEEEECLCSTRCECGITVPMLDECICTSGCTEVGHGENMNMNMSEHTKDIQLGIKYCPGNDVSLPRYTFNRYKPSTSRALDTTTVISAQLLLHHGTESDDMLVEEVGNIKQEMKN